MDVVRVKNVGTVPFRGAYNSRPFVIEPGEEALLEREAACIHFGDWTQRNLGENRYREREYRRIRSLWGAFEDDTLWKERKPHIEIRLPSGEKIVTVLEDPEGKDLRIEAPTENQSKALDAMQAQIDQLRRQLDIAQSPKVEIPEDTPETAVRRPRPRGFNVEAASSE